MRKRHEFSSLWNVKLSLSGFTSYTHWETLRLFMEAGWDQQIKLAGGTESNINLCCYISPSPLEIKMLFRKSYSTGRGIWELEGSSFHRWENRRLGRLLFSQGYSMNMVQSSGNQERPDTGEKNSERMWKNRLVPSAVCHLGGRNLFHTWSLGVKDSRVSCDGQLVVLPRIGRPRRAPHTLPVSQSPHLTNLIPRATLQMFRLSNDLMDCRHELVCSLK